MKKQSPVRYEPRKTPPGKEITNELERIKNNGFEIVTMGYAVFDKKYGILRYKNSDCSYHISKHGKTYKFLGIRNVHHFLNGYELGKSE